MKKREGVPSLLPKRMNRILVGLFLFSILTVVGIQLLNNPPHSKSVFNVQDFGAEGNGVHNDTEAIQKALNIAKTSESSIKIVVPAGTYKLKNTLRIYKNTHLVLEDGAVFLRSHNNTIMINGDPGQIYSGYNGQGNIIIEGGIWDGNATHYPDPANAIGLARGKNITIRNIEVRDVSSDHGIDLNSSENVVIENSRFLGFKDTTPDKSRFFSEAIQISEHTRLGFTAFGEYDGTPNKNVIVRNCYFGASGTKGTTAWPVGVGNHGSVYNKFNSDIKIYDNTFEGMTFVGIRNSKWKDTTIKDNKFLNCMRGIALSNSNGTGESSKMPDGTQTGLPQSGSNTIISGNVFENTHMENIYGAGWPKNTVIAKVDSITISDNIFKNQLGINQKPNIHLAWANNITISNNTMSKVYRGIYLTFGSNVNINKNTFKNVTTEALLVDEPNAIYRLKGYTNNITVTQNTISGFGKVGLLIQYTKEFTITRNKIAASSIEKSSKRDAIIAGSFCRDGIITENTALTTGNQQKDTIEVTSTCKNIHVTANKAEEGADSVILLQDID